MKNDTSPVAENPKGDAQLPSERRLHDALSAGATVVAAATLFVYSIWIILPEERKGELIALLVAAITQDGIAENGDRVLRDFPTIVAIHGLFLAIFLRQAAKNVGMGNQARSSWIGLVGPVPVFMAYLVLIHFATGSVPTLAWLYAEDQPLEYMTALFSATASVVLVRTWGSVESLISRSLLAIIGGAALVFALEEISWGQRIIGFSSPSVFAEHNHQGETTLHNFANPVLNPATAALCFVVALYLLFLPRLARAFPSEIRPLFMPKDALAMVPAFLAAGWWAVVWDGELAEELLSVLMLSSAVGFAKHQRHLSDNRPTWAQ